MHQKTPNKSPLGIAAVSVLYHPKKHFIDNIYSYLDEVDIVYAIDNSEVEPAAFLNETKGIEKIKYIPNNENLGISAVLNQAAEMAIRDGYDLLLTMDQDSKATPGMLKELLNILSHVDIATIGIICPNHLVPHKTLASPQTLYKEAEVVMTSGNLINLNAFKKIGPYDENLFIDCVDHDYCLRAHLNGFKVLIASKAVLLHQLGKPMVCRDILGRKKVVKSYPPIRKYYRVRNRLYMMDKYKNQFPNYHKASRQAIWQDIKYTIKFEKNKYDKLAMMWKGYKDFKNKKWGRFETEKVGANAKDPE